MLFSIPLLAKVPEPTVRAADGDAEIGRPLRRTFKQLRETVVALRTDKQANLMLAAFLVCNEGIGAIIKMAAIYGAEIGLDQGAVIGSILLVQFVGIPCTILFGALVGNVGAQPLINLGLTVYVGIAALAYVLTSATQFSHPRNSENAV